MIPCGKNIIPRTPFHGDMEKEAEVEKSPSKSLVQNADRKQTNFIPCGKNIPRTPFVGADNATTKADGKLNMIYELRLTNFCPNSTLKYLLQQARF